MSTEGKKKNNNVGYKFFTVFGTILCIILIPVLIINVTLIIKSFTNKDEVPSLGGKFPLIVLTDSMREEIKGGDLIICDVIDAEDVKVNDIISFFDPAGNGTSIVTHRVLEIIEEDGTIMFRTKGDNNNTEDKKPVPADKLVGIYRMRIPGAGNIAMFMQSTAGLIVCVVVPIILLVGYDMLRRRKYEASKKQDTDALLAELEELRAMKAKQDEQSDQ